MGIKLPKGVKRTDERAEMGFDIPNGKYLVKINACEERTPRKGGDKYLHTELEILDALREEGEKVIGFKIFDTFALSDDAMWRLTKLLDAAYPPTFEGDEIPSDIIGKKIVVKTKMEEYQGFEKTRCQKIEPLTAWNGVTMNIDKDGSIEYKGKKGAASAPSSREKKSEEVVM